MRQIDTLVPFYVSVPAWDSGKDIVSWAADQLVEAFPQLGREVSRRVGGRVADDWVTHRILLIIDGFDELPRSQCAKAITDINDRADLPVVVTSRPQEYKDAFDAVGRPISGSIVLNLHPLDVSEVENYLLNTTATLPAGRWKDVFDRLRKEGENPLKEVLTNPLMLWLASRVYEAKNSFPGELANDSRFCDREVIEGHLLGSFLPAIYSPRAGALRPRWTPEQARRYLAFLAYRTERTRSPDIAWWRLTRAVRGWRPVAVTVRAMLLFGVAWWLAAWLVRLHPGWRRSFPVETVFASGPVGRQVVPLVGYLKHLTVVYLPSDVRSLYVRWARTSIGYVPWQSLASLEVWVALLALIAGSWSAMRESRRHVTLRVVRIRSLKSLGGAGISLALTAVFAGLLLLGIAVLDHAIFRRNGHIVMSGRFPVHSAQVLLLFVILWMLSGVPSQFIHRMDSPGLASPSGVLRFDRHATFFAILMSRLLLTVAVWLYFGPLIAAMYALYCVASLTCRLLLGGAGTESDRFADARVWLAASVRMPWSVMSFLADASERGVLRQSGAVYQFRHIRLRQELSARHPRLSRGLTSMIIGVIRRWRPTREIAGRWSPPSARPWSEPFWALRFEEFAATELPEAYVAGQMYDAGPGYVQPFTGAEDGRSMMICALPGGEPVIVEASVWQALRNAASLAMRDAECAGRDNLLTSVGFPASDVIQAGQTHMVLKGGSWGDGFLVRPDERSSWHWKPSWSFKPYAGCFDPWERRGAQLRVSAEVDFFWRSRRLIVKPETYEVKADQLAVASLPQAVTDMWTRRGGGMPEVKWTLSSLSDKREVSLWWEITAQDKRSVMTGNLRVTVLKMRLEVCVTSKVVLSIQDVAAWRDYLQTASGRRLDDSQLRLTLDELTAYPIHSLAYGSRGPAQVRCRRPFCYIPGNPRVYQPSAE